MGSLSNSAVRRQRATAVAAQRMEAAGSARERILASADRLFYGHGIQAVGVQWILNDAQVTRVTFYRHFPSKDDLVLAYLDRRAGQARAAVQAIIDGHPGNPRQALHELAVGFVEDGVVDEYRGCTFVNAAAEYGEPGHPVRGRAAAQRSWINHATEGLLREAGHPDPVAATRTLLALRTGYIFSAGLEEDAGWADQFVAAHDQIASAG